MYFLMHDRSIAIANAFNVCYFSCVFANVLLRHGQTLYVNKQALCHMKYVSCICICARSLVRIMDSIKKWSYSVEITSKRK